MMSIRNVLIPVLLYVCAPVPLPGATTINLGAVWKFKTDPGNVGEAQQWYGDTFNDSSWQNLNSGSSWESQGISHHGFAWYRKQVTIPAAEAGVPLTIILADLFSDDDFYWNGELMGGIWGHHKYDNRGLRTYTIPAEKIRFGQSNTIAIRLWGGALAFQGVPGSGQIRASGLVAGIYKMVLDRYQLMARPSGGSITSERPVVGLWDFSGSQQGTPFEMIFRVDPGILSGAPANLAYTIKDFYGQTIKTGTASVATGADGIPRGVATIDPTASQTIYCAGRFRVNWKITHATTGVTLFDNVSNPVAADHLNFSARDQAVLPALPTTNESTPYGNLKLIDQINCATSLNEEIHPYLQGGYAAGAGNSMTPGPKATHTVKTILGKQARETENTFGWFAYRIGRGTLTPGKTYLLRIEYPEDKPRYCPVEIQVGQNFMDVGWRNGVGANDMYDNWPLTNSWNYYDVIVPLGEETTGAGGTGDGDASKGFWVYFFNKMRPGVFFTMYSGGPAVATMKLYEIDAAAHSPLVTLPAGLPQRVLTFDWEHQPTAVPSDLVNYAKLMGYSAISPLTLKWAFYNWGDPVRGYHANNVDAAHYWVNSAYATGSGIAPAAPVPGSASIHQGYLNATRNSGVDYIPRIEYGGSFDLPASARAIGADGTTAKPNRFATWGANLLNAATYTDLKAYLDSQIMPKTGANPQLKGVIWRIRSDRMQISYGPGDVDLFCAETATIKPSGMTNAKLAAWASSGTVGGKYATWWHGKRAGFHKQVSDLLKTYRQDMSLYYYNWDSDKFSMLLPDLNTSRFYTQVNLLGGPAAYANDRAARAALNATDYINVMTGGDFSNAFFGDGSEPGPNRPDYAVRPSFYSDLSGIQLFAPANWLCYADKPEYLNYFQTAEGMAMSNCVSYDEVGRGAINPKYEGSMILPGGGPYSMALELLAYYHADARTLTYTVYTYGRGFADAHRRFAQAFRALPAIPGRVVPGTSVNTKVRVYSSGTRNYIGIAYKGHSAASLAIDIPGSWSGATVKNLVTGATIPTTIVGGNLRLAFSSGPMELNSFLVTGGTPALAPVAPAAVSTTATNGRIALTWQSSPGATSYIIKRSSTLAGGPYITVATSTSANCTDTAVSNGTTYYYQIIAVNANGESAASSQATATPGLIGGSDGQITASFADGNSTTAVDGYGGMAGGGWASPWNALASGGSFSNTVTTANPIEGGGNYLRANLVSGTAASAYSGAIGRKFDATVVDNTQPYTIQYKIRWDSSYNTADSIKIFGDVSTAYAWAPSTTTTWQISTGNSGGSPVWRVFHGNGAGGATALDTTMPLTVGTVYTMTVKVNPASKSWTLLIDNGSAQYQSSPLGFRNAATSGAGNSFYFGGTVLGPGRTLGFSVDSIILTNGEIEEPSAASITANFTGGNSTSQPDGYIGVAGGGWVKPWVANKSGAGSFANTVTSSSPLGGGGNYLSARLNAGTVAGPYSGAISRKFDVGILNPTQPHTVSFKIRLDSAIMAMSDSIVAFGDVSAENPWSTGSSNTWAVSGYYNNGVPIWRVFDGNRAGGSTAINTTMPLTVGTVYTMTVQVDPVTKTWIVQIADGSGSYQSGVLGFRNAAASGAGNTLAFGAVVRDTTGNLRYSIDGLKIQH